MVYFKEDGLSYTLKSPKYRVLGFLFLILIFILVGFALYQDFIANNKEFLSSTHGFFAEEPILFIVGFLALGGLFIKGFYQMKKPRLTIDMAELTLKGHYGFKSYHFPLMTLHQFAIYPAKKGKEERNQPLYLRVHYFKDETYLSQTILQGEKEKLLAILDEITDILAHYRQSLKGLAATQIFLDKIPPTSQKPLKTLSLHRN